MNTTLEQDQERAALAIQKAEAAKALYLFFKNERPDLGCTANENMIRAYLDNRQITTESLREAVAYLEQYHKKALAYKTQRQAFDYQLQKDAEEQHAAEKARQNALVHEAKEREKLTGQIKSLLKVSPFMWTNEYNKYQLKDAKGNWLCPTQIMRDRLAKLRDVGLFRGATTEQLKQTLKRGKPAISQYPPLPSSVSKFNLLHVMTAAELRSALQKYGRDQINAVLQSPDEE